MTDASSARIEDFDLYLPRPLQDLQGLFGEFRATCPVGRSPHNGGFWLVTSYQDVHRMARDAETFSNRQGIVIPPVGGEPLIPMDLDPPEHGQYRTLLQTWLAPASVKRFEPRVREMAGEYLAKLDSPCDLVADFVLPYSLEVVTTVIGVPKALREAMVSMMRTVLGEGGENHLDAAAALVQFGQVLQALLIDPRRAEGPTEDPDDVVDLLVGSEFNGRSLTDAEIRQTVLALLGAGFETSYKTLAACFWYLAENGEAWKAIRSGAVPFTGAFEELLRFSAPASVGRTATTDVTIGEHHIKAGDSVLLCLPSANRDDAEFPNADDLVLTRETNRHLTFGTGIHRCIGMHVARLMLSVALQEALETLEQIWVPTDGTLSFTGSQAAGITSLPFAFARG